MNLHVQAAKSWVTNNPDGHKLMIHGGPGKLGA